MAEQVTARLMALRARFVHLPHIFDINLTVRHQHRYFVVDGSEFVYYRDEQSFRTKPHAPCKRTVFSLRGYEVLVG